MINTWYTCKIHDILVQVSGYTSKIPLIQEWMSLTTGVEGI